MSEKEISAARNRIIGKTAVVFSGLGDNRPNTIIRDLQRDGYRVVYMEWNEMSLAPRDVDLVIGHSAGSARAIAEFGGSDIPILALSSPVRSQQFDNVRYSSNLADPVSVFGMLLDPIHAIEDILNGDVFFDPVGNPHDKNEAWDNVKGDYLEND